MSFPTSRFGDPYDDSKKWESGVLADDKCIYAAPFHHDKILKINPSDRTTVLIDIANSGIVAKNKEKYCGGVKARNGCIYFVPHCANRVLKFDPQNSQAPTLIGGAHEGEHKWSGGAIGEDGNLYCAPFDAAKILKVNTENDTTNITETVKLVGKHKYSGCVASEDKKKIYFIPYEKSQELLEYTVATEICTLIELNVDRPDHAWYGGVLGSDGCIYGIPCHARKFLKYDPSTKSATLVGDLRKGGWKYRGGVSVDNGRNIYCIPYNAKRVIRYNINTKKITKIGAKYKSGHKWSGGVDDGKGKIIGVSSSAEKILSISPPQDVRFRYDLKNTGIYKLYANTIFNQVVTMGESGEALSIGLFSPSGSGKSFLWNLIEKEFNDEKRRKDEENDGDGESHVTKLIKAFYECCLSCLINDEEKVQQKLEKFDSKFKSSFIVIGASLLWSALVSVTGFIFKVIICHYYISANKTSVADGKKDYIIVHFNVWSSRNKENPGLVNQIFESVINEFGEETVTSHRSAMISSDSIATGKRRNEEEEMKEKRKKAFGQGCGLFFMILCTLGVLASACVWIYLTNTCEVNSYITVNSNVEIQLQGFNISEAPSSSQAPSSAPSPQPEEKCTDDKTISILIFAVTSVISIFLLVMQYIRPVGETRQKIFCKKRNKNAPLEQEDVEYMFAFLRSKNTRIILLVDDLDRCDQGLAMDVLNDISDRFRSTVGRSPRPITTLLAADSEILVQYIEADLQKSGIETMHGLRHLENFFDLGFTIPSNQQNKTREKFWEKALDHHKLTTAQLYKRACAFRHGEELNDIFCRKENEMDEMGYLIKVAKEMNGAAKYKFDRLSCDKKEINSSSFSREEFLLTLRNNFETLDTLDTLDISDDGGTGDDIGNNTDHEYTAKMESKEEKFILEYTKIIDEVPRTINRMINMYVMSRHCAMKTKNEGVLNRKNLFLFTVLQELCPYRTSWLVFISRCVQDEHMFKNGSTTSESLALYSLLERLAQGDIGALKLSVVYARIVCNILYCLPNAKNHMGADSSVWQYQELLKELTVKDLESLLNYRYNLPHYMMRDIEKYKDHCIIRTTEVTVDNNPLWIASFKKIPAITLLPTPSSL